ncbi:MAG: manganese efflux pump MntP family protein, partial [Clostridiales bacterium]|nr:manganese efflux pump MntP family protein [Clostridiales bacterium]
LMLIEGFDKRAVAKPRFGIKTVAFQSFATSVDAFACGLTLNVLPFQLWVEGLTIGGITAVLCAIGIFFAGAIGKRVARPERFKIIGGCVLIALALKNLIYCFI